MSELPVRAFAIISYLHRCRRLRHFKLFGNFPCRSHTHTHPPNVCNTRHGMFQPSKAVLNSLSSHFQSGVWCHCHCRTHTADRKNNNIQFSEFSMLPIIHYTKRNESSKIWTRFWMAISCVFNIFGWRRYTQHTTSTTFILLPRPWRQCHPFILLLLVFLAEAFRPFRRSRFTRVCVRLWNVTETNPSRSCECIQLFT